MHTQDQADVLPSRLVFGLPGVRVVCTSPDCAMEGSDAERDTHTVVRHRPLVGDIDR